MVKKVILGTFVAVGLLAAAGTGFIALRGDATGRAQAESDKAALSQSLEDSFGGQVEVDFVCQFPVVGVGPCVMDSAMDSREVILTLTGPRLSEGLTPDEQALQIARLAHGASSFARKADKIEVNFAEGNVVRKYTFDREALKAGAVPAPDPPIR